jgi:hypothetical protein
MAWHERKFTGLALRFAGLTLIVIAWRLGHPLFAAPDPQAKLRALPYLLALVWIVSSCVGSALAVLGRHLFDPVELPSRWKIHAPSQGSRISGPSAIVRPEAASCASSPAFLP